MSSFGGSGKENMQQELPKFLQSLRALKINPRSLSLLLILCLFLLVTLWLVRKGSSQRPNPTDASATQSTVEGVRFIPGSQNSASEAASPGQPLTLMVYVAGAVNNPGVVTLPAGSRVADALAKAEGMSVKADQALVEKSLNLAEKLQDGDKIYIPALGEDLTGLDFLTSGASPASSGVSNGARTTTSAGVPGVVNLNTASSEEIASAGLYRIGPKTAEKIVSYRQQFGPFKSLEDLLNVPGIGEAILEGIRGSVTL